MSKKKGQQKTTPHVGEGGRCAKPSPSRHCACGCSKHGSGNPNGGERIGLMREKKKRPRVTLLLHSQTGQSWSNNQFWEILVKDWSN